MENFFVRKLRALGSLDAAAVAALNAAVSRPQRIAAKRDLIREGDRPGPLFVILEGWACRYKVLPMGTRQILAYLLPGDCCDLHMGLLAEMDHSIQTITPALVATIHRADMEALLDEHPGVAKVMYSAQLIDEGTMRAWITSMGRRTSIERVAHLMCELYLRNINLGVAGDAGSEIGLQSLSSDAGVILPLSQQMLADSLGMTPVHINRVLKELRLAGAMTLQRGSLLITNPKKLVEIAGFDENYLHRRLRNVS